VEEVECIICLEKFVEGDVMKTLACNHEFHGDCIDQV